MVVAQAAAGPGLHGVGGRGQGVGAEEQAEKRVAPAAC